jgi:hypothetical protein
VTDRNRATNPKSERNGNMRLTTSKSADTFSPSSGVVEVPTLSAQEPDRETRSITSRLEKLAATEMLSLEIETFLLLLVALIGALMVAHGWEQFFVR